MIPRKWMQMRTGEQLGETEPKGGLRLNCGPTWPQLYVPRIGPPTSTPLPNKRRNGPTAIFPVACFVIDLRFRNCCLANLPLIPIRGFSVSREATGRTSSRYTVQVILLLHDNSIKYGWNTALGCSGYRINKIHSSAIPNSCHNRLNAYA